MYNIIMVELQTHGGAKLIHERLKKLRKSLGLTQAEFGEKIELTNVTLSLMEKGERKITDRTIKFLEIEFNVNEHWLRTGKGEMYKPENSHDNLMGLIGQLTDHLDEGVGNHSEFKEWLILKILKLPDDQLDALKEMILSFVDDEIKDLDKKQPSN